MSDNIDPNSKSFTFFGFEIKRKDKDRKAELPAIVPPNDEDGAAYVTAAGHHYAHYIDIDGASQAKDNAQLIRQYRGISYHPEVDMAIEEITNEAIVTSDKKSCVDLNLDEIEVSENIKKKIVAEFEHIVSLLNFNENGHDIFRSWYVDGRLFHQLVIDPEAVSAGIQDIRLLDATKVKKVKNVKYDRDINTGVKTVKSVEEFFIYEDKPGGATIGGQMPGPTTGIKLTTDSVSYVTSGLLDENRKKVVSYLHKALKPTNQLRMMEDALVIYRLARAPERRIFYIDVGNLAPGKAETYMKNIMAKYRNKLVYDANTGQLKDNRKHMSMLEDFWLPRKEGGRGTEITTLPGGDNLGQIEDIIFFQRKLYKSLNVPLSRLEQESQFSLGRTTEITRDEVKFQKFIDRLRQKFSKLFTEILKTHCVLKGIFTEDDWQNWKNDVKVDFLRDNHFDEMKNTEIMREKLTTMDQAAQYAGTYFSKEWLMKNVMGFSDDEWDEMSKQMKKEEKAGEYEEEEQPGQGPVAQPQQPPQPVPVQVVEPEDKEKPKPKEKPKAKPKEKPKGD